MYGIINKSIENLVKEKFGEEQWALVKKRSGVDIDFFISNEPYDDRITYQLASAISAELDIPLDQVPSTPNHTQLPTPLQTLQELQD